MRNNRIFKSLASLRLTVVCLICGMVLVFVGTIAQVDMGIYAAQAKYFRSLFIFWQIPGTGVRIPILPGGYLVGGLLVLNLICAHTVRFGLRKDKLGLLMVHSGLILLLLGQLATDLLSVESLMRLSEGQPKSHSEDQRLCELAIMETSQPDHNQVVAISESYLARNPEIRVAELPFTIKVRQYLANSTNIPPIMAKGPSMATKGLGERLQFAAAPIETRMEHRNMPTAYLEFVGAEGSLGVWAVSLWFNPVQSLTVAGKTYEFALRPERYYRPFSLELEKFSHDKYLGTDIPKNFSSDVRVLNPATGENRKVRIYMNNPLRYAGETFYQSGFDERDPRVTILQVVRNPGWLTPYFSCILVGLGLVLHFLTHLLGFLKKKAS